MGEISIQVGFRFACYVVPEECSLFELCTQLGMYTKVAHFVGVVGDYVVGFGLLHKYTIVVWYVSREGGSTSAS